MFKYTIYIKHNVTAHKFNVSFNTWLYVSLFVDDLDSTKFSYYIKNNWA